MQNIACKVPVATRSLSHTLCFDENVLVRMDNTPSKYYIEREKPLDKAEDVKHMKTLHPSVLCVDL